MARTSTPKYTVTFHKSSTVPLEVKMGNYTGEMTLTVSGNSALTMISLNLFRKLKQTPRYQLFTVTIPDAYINIPPEYYAGKVVAALADTVNLLGDDLLPDATTLHQYARAISEEHFPAATAFSRCVSEKLHLPYGDLCVTRDNSSIGILFLDKRNITTTLAVVTDSYNDHALLVHAITDDSTPLKQVAEIPIENGELILPDDDTDPYDLPF